LAPLLGKWGDQIDLGLADRVAIVTGTGEGVGYAVALGLVQEDTSIAQRAGNR
jgi:NAD(P)-dependent dehydrogenase (short-subunit alcohol dehydrogenase family)